ncbi:MAG: hypothetical protein JXD22_09725 [Sedimentisphaerales bacterium]|nr:hypothetical protein [Sedimentisphaerales bacterium]
MPVKTKLSVDIVTFARGYARADWSEMAFGLTKPERFVMLRSRSGKLSQTPGAGRLGTTRFQVSEVIFFVLRVSAFG